MIILKECNRQTDKVILEEKYFTTKISKKMDHRPY